MASGGELAFVSLRLMVKFLDNVFFVLGKGLLATLLTVAVSILRLVLGRDVSRESDTPSARASPPPPRRAPPPPPPNPPVAFSRHPTATP